MSSARERAEALMDAAPYTGGWRGTAAGRALRDAIEAALLAEREAGIEEAAKVADTFTCGLCGADGKAGSAIRALKEQRP